MATRLQKPVMVSDVRGDGQEEHESAYQNVETPLGTPGAMGAGSIQATPSIMERRDPLDHGSGNEDGGLDEAPPPYTEYEGTSVNAPQIAVVEHSDENSPQLVIAPQAEFPEVLRREEGMETILTPSTALGTPVEDRFPAPLRARQSSSISSIPRRPVPSRSADATTTSFSSAKAREAGFEIEQPPSLDRSSSSSSAPGITVLPPTDTLRHTREQGKVMAYLIPFPKPRLKDVKLEDIPDRFLIYTPPLPPLSKPAPGEKESQWHKTQRLWQEDVRRATMTQASRVTWKGMKARTTAMVNRGVSKTRSSTVEFLDRVSGGAIASSTQDVDEDEVTTPDATSTQELPASFPLETAQDSPSSPTPSGITQSSTNRSTSSISTIGAPKPKSLDSLTLIHPPSLALTPSQIRTEFVDTLMRTREQSRNKALVASALIPFALTMDACLVVTLGGLTQASSVWAYQNTRGTLASGKITKGLAYTNESETAVELEAKGCTCGHHEAEFGCAETMPKAEKKTKGKSKKKDEQGIAMSTQSSPALDPFTRYLELACLQKNFTMFPQILSEKSDDPTEDGILKAIGWAPTRRSGRDLDVEEGGKTQRLSAEQDAEWQWREAREDVASVVRKAAAEWVGVCKGLKKST